MSKDFRGVPLDSWGWGPGFDPRVLFCFSVGSGAFFILFAESGVLFVCEVNYMYNLQDPIYYY